MNRRVRKPFPWRAVRVRSDGYVLDLWDGQSWRPWNDYALTRAEVARFMAEARNLRAEWIGWGE